MRMLWLTVLLVGSHRLVRGRHGREGQHDEPEICRPGGSAAAPDGKTQRERREVIGQVVPPLCRVERFPYKFDIAFVVLAATCGV